MSLTPEQRCFAEHPNGAFVEACPGAGKTKTVIARLQHISATLPPRKGVAVLSFTNKAIEEFCSRFAKSESSHLLQYPGFIGTFDSFVRHFLFEPSGVPGNNMKPHVVDSWDTLSSTEIRLVGRYSFRGPGVKLDWFDPETNTINSASITHIGLQRHVRDHKAQYETAARARRDALHRAGFYSTADARVIAWQRVDSPNWGDALGSALAGRFVEVIVDEAQDCNQRDLDILRWLRRHGVRVTLVCDMDQAIYEFRDGNRTHLENFACSYPNNDRLRLTGNFRSAPSVCGLAATLKTNSHADTSLGVTQHLHHPIAIYSYQGHRVVPNIGHWFIAHCEDATIGMTRSDLIVLAHSAKTARLASGNFVEATGGQSKIEQATSALSKFWTATTGRERYSALVSVERWLLDIFSLRNGNEPVSQAVLRNKLDPRRLKRQALELALSSPRTCLDTPESVAAWIENLRGAVQKFGLPMPHGHSLRSILRNPPNNSWLAHLEQADATTGLRYSTIHNAKGGEFPSVCVVIPPDDRRGFTSALFESWENQADYEPKRVIYVGITRAKCLAALAIPQAFTARLLALLDDAGVPYTSVIG